MHSFCRVCVRQYWEQKSSRECPISRRKSSVEVPPVNLALRSIVESFSKQKSESEMADKSDTHCSLHGEKPLFFCEHDKEPLCVVCQTSKRHRNHTVSPVEEAVLDLKEEIKPELNLIKEKLKSFTEAEQECMKTAEHIRNYKNIKERAQCTLQDPELLSGALIDEAKHLGNLKFRVWEKMLGMVQYTPVMLDPNTAAPWLSLSDDLTTVRNIYQKCPDNPERFSNHVMVLGSEGFTSGKHSWEVDVGNKHAWDIGVVKESINRKGDIEYSPESGFWVLSLRNGDDYTASGASHHTLKRKPQSIRVELDYDRGEVFFFDSSDMSLIYTFTDTFTERVFPYFGPCLREDSTEGPLQICPVKVSITVTSSR
ncbi:LOW QUALITY PROTEIN: E3 ubiquitin-protein ligase TRIM35-like [Conger conger]|uniref:LOW QUALITY PROTEIN: E3 ubiquitin-protein ligase TRIM35-like n=1 Tax=Conger conger TaxID=82655 RepID=UPI002A5A03C6|nr:LOW QUALITY PROTEIN: E3 ubiquitin-protein ligase TRIM35-like [Conger conger]